MTRKTPICCICATPADIRVSSTAGIQNFCLAHRAQADAAQADAMKAWQAEAATRESTGWKYWQNRGIKAGATLRVCIGSSLFGGPIWGEGTAWSDGRRGAHVIARRNGKLLRLPANTAHAA